MPKYRELIYVLAILTVGCIWRIQTFLLRMAVISEPMYSDYTVLETSPIRNDAPFNFSACLLIVDANKILPEWLAYHFEVLPLRRLIIATDPYSLTSPMYIANTYRKLLDMQITIWEDKDYLHSGNSSWERPVYHENVTSGERYKAHLWRQVTFYTQCALQLKSEGLEWLVLIDVDEFMSFNFYPKNIAEKKNTTYHNCENLDVQGVAGCRDDGYPIDMMQHFGLEFPRQLGDPSSTLAHFIERNWNKNVYRSRKGSRTCDIAARVVTGNHEDASVPLELDIPKLFNVENFRTLRYRYHDHLSLTQLPGKAVLNLKKWKGKNRLGVHRGNLNCFNAKERAYPEPSLSFFRIHHYVGSFEEFMMKPSSHTQTLESFKARNKIQISGQVNEVTGWLGSFIRRVGASRANYLTQGLRTWAFRSDLEYFNPKISPAQSRLK